MATILILAAAYAAYSNRNKGDASDQEGSSATVDPSIHLEGKTAVSLLEMERETALLEVPHLTVSFFEGSYQSITDFLATRIQQILEQNPWLGGWLIRDPNDNDTLKLFYDATGQDCCQGQLKIFEPFVINLHRNSPYKDYGKLLVAMDAVVRKGSQTVGKNTPLWKIAIVPDSLQPDKGFALVFSLSHLLGDANIFYRLFEMLDPDSLVEKLDPHRPAHYEQAVAATLGQGEARYLASVAHRPLLDLGFFQNLSTDHDPMVLRLFYIDEKWLHEFRGSADPVRRSSIYEADRSAALVSVHAMIASWFFLINDASIAMVWTDLRDRLEGCPVTSHHAGNYVGSVICPPEDYATPGKVQRAINDLRRSSSTELPAFRGDMQASMSVNWANFYFHEMKLGPGVTQVLHLPVFEVDFFDYVPDRLSCIVTFTACPYNAETGTDRKAGACVICRKSVWAKIEVSGIVEKVIDGIEQRV